MEEPKWLIEDIWTAGSHGIIGGEPKTSKTTLALALALAVASGQPFLGRYAVGTQGPVLMVQEENAPWMMQDRMRKLAAHSGLISLEDARVQPASPGGLGSTVLSVDMPADVPFWLLNNYGFDLSIEEHRDMLEGYVEEIRPILVVLDPMYLIFGQADANNMADLQPFLKWVIQLRYTYGCAVAIVHHMGKKNDSTSGRRAGQRLIGSATLHGFTDSALYTSKLEDPREGWTRALIETEFRSMPPQPGIEMAWRFGDPGSLDMQLEVMKQDVSEMIAEIVSSRERVTVALLVKETGVGEKTIRRHIEKSDRLGFSSRGRGKIQYIIAVGRNGASHDSE
jgi:RecA-family ATPase